MVIEKTKVYIVMVSIAAFFMLFYLYSIWDLESFQVYPFLLFLFLNFAAESMPVSLHRGLYVTVSFATVFAAMLLLQPLEVVVVSACGYLFSLGKERVAVKYLFNTSQMVLCSGFAVLFLYRMGGVNIESIGLREVLILVVTSSIYYLTNALLVTAVVSLAHGEMPYAFFLANISWATPNFLCLAPLGLLVAIIYNNVGGWGLLLFFIPLLLARHSFKSYMDMRQSFLDTIHSLTTAIDAKDAYTRGHSARVADYAEAIAKELGYGLKELEILQYISLLHDTGKIGIKENILNKPGRLSQEEFEEMKRHSILGAEIVKNVSMLAEGEKTVRYHHESFDGSGYPEGLKGMAIPEGARIIAVADAFDAMTTDRPYRKALTREEALGELAKCAGTQFDPRIVEAFINAYPEMKMTVLNMDLSKVEAAVSGEREVDRIPGAH